LLLNGAHARIVTVPTARGRWPACVISRWLRLQGFPAGCLAGTADRPRAAAREVEPPLPCAELPAL